MAEIPSRVALAALCAGALLLPAPLDSQTAAQLQIMQSGRRTMTAERMRDGEKIVLDGVLDEPVWDRAQHGGEFIMQDPVLGPSAMQALRQIIRGCPEPMEVADGGHFVQEWGGPIARAALSHFRLSNT